MTTLTPQPSTPSKPLRRQSEKRYTNDYIKHLQDVKKRALFSIFIGSAAAINQTDLKKLLGYSSVSQIGYIIMGLTLLSPLGLTGGILHIFNHAIIKAGLFLCAGGFIHQTGSRHLAQLKGIGKKMPIVTACFTMAALSMIGLPPFNGFISKWFM